MDISKDSYAILLLCSDLALKSVAGSVKAYTVVQWSNLAERLVQNNLTPKDLFDIANNEIKNKLVLSYEEEERINSLMSRGGQFGVELSSLNEKGIFTLTRADPKYPLVLKNKLKRLAPPVLFYAGNLKLIDNKGVSIVGSRDVDEVGIKFTEKLAKRCANDGLNIISGGAKGVDSIAVETANNLNGTTIVFVSDSLEKRIRTKVTREAIIKKQALFLSSYRPDMPFQTFAAMERNKYIYALSDFVVIISSDYKKGGTWAGAKENLNKKWTPMFVRNENNIPEGNQQLLKNNDVYSINNEILENKAFNIFDWVKKEAKETNKLKHIEKQKEPEKTKKSGVVKGEQLSLF